MKEAIYFWRNGFASPISGSLTLCSCRHQFLSTLPPSRRFRLSLHFPDLHIYQSIDKARASPTLISDLGHDAYSSEGNPIVALASLLVDGLSRFEEEVEIADKIMSIGVGNFKGGGTIGQGRQKESGYLPPTRTWKLESRTRHQGKLLYRDGRIFR
ncbi:unnamed protein product [Linum trigynum]|uniref:Uncharacterized protein n=1 Tax=Linum trigynum TaxID=586398 RepID=A0AAV2DG92_9ROSI